MTILLKDWLDQFKTALDAIQNETPEEKKSNILLQDMLYISKELITAQNSSILTFFPHLTNAKKASNKYFSNNELIEKNIPTDEVSRKVLEAYRNFANSWSDVSDKPKTSNFSGAPDYQARVISIDKFLLKFENNTAPTVRIK